MFFLANNFPSHAIDLSTRKNSSTKQAGVVAAHRQIEVEHDDVLGQQFLQP